MSNMTDKEALEIIKSLPWVKVRRKKKKAKRKKVDKLLSRLGRRYED